MTKELIVDASGKTVNVDTRQIVGGEKLRFDQQGVAHIDEQGSGETTDLLIKLQLR